MFADERFAAGASVRPAPARYLGSKSSPTGGQVDQWRGIGHPVSWVGSFCEPAELLREKKRA